MILQRSELLQGCSSGKCTLQASITAAVEAACSEAHAAARAGATPVVCITGSLHTVAQALRELPLPALGC